MRRRSNNGTVECYVKNPHGREGEQVRNSGAFGSSDKWKYCKAVNLQADPNRDKCEDMNCKAVNLQAISAVSSGGAMATLDDNMVIYNLKAMSMCLVNFEDFVDYGMVNFSALMNEMIPDFVNKKILDYVIKMISR